MKELIVILCFAANMHVVYAQDSKPDILPNTATKEKALLAKDSLKQTIQFLEEISHLVTNSKTDTKKQIDKTWDYIKQGTEMETQLERNFSMLHPQKQTMKVDLVRRFHFIMQSLALYRSDLRSSGYLQTTSSEKEYQYLTTNLSSLIEQLEHMTTFHQHTDWDKQAKIDELNGYLHDAYGNDPPIRFSLEGISSKEVKSLSWEDIKIMIVNRKKGEVTITTNSGRELQFNFTEDQYTHIASMHVHFQAFYKKIMKE